MAVKPSLHEYAQLERAHVSIPTTFDLPAIPTQSVSSSAPGTVTTA